MRVTGHAKYEKLQQKYDNWEDRMNKPVHPAPAADANVVRVQQFESPAGVPLLRHSSWPWLPSSAVKYRIPLTVVM